MPMRNGVRCTPINTQRPTPNAQPLPTPKSQSFPVDRHWELVVGSGWGLVVGSWELIKNSIEKPSLRIARAEQPIRRAIGQGHIPLVAIPTVPPPVPRCAPGTRAALHSPTAEAAA